MIRTIGVTYKVSDMNIATHVQQMSHNVSMPFLYCTVERCAAVLISIIEDRD